MWNICIKCQSCDLFCSHMYWYQIQITESVSVFNLWQKEGITIRHWWVFFYLIKLHLVSKTNELFKIFVLTDRDRWKIYEIDSPVLYLLMLLLDKKLPFSAACMFGSVIFLCRGRVNQRESCLNKNMQNQHENATMHWTLNVCAIYFVLKSYETNTNRVLKKMLNAPHFVLKLLCRTSWNVLQCLVMDIRPAEKIVC